MTAITYLAVPKHYTPHNHHKVQRPMYTVRRARNLEPTQDRCRSHHASIDLCLSLTRSIHRTVTEESSESYHLVRSAIRAVGYCCVCQYSIYRTFHNNSSLKTERQYHGSRISDDQSRRGRSISPIYRPAYYLPSCGDANFPFCPLKISPTR